MRYPTKDEQFIPADLTEPRPYEIGEQRVCFLCKENGWAYPYYVPGVMLDVFIAFLRKKHPDGQWSVWIEEVIGHPRGKPLWSANYQATGELFCKIMADKSLWLMNHPCPYADQPAIVEANA